MKIAIIGAGNMGGAIARGMAAKYPAETLEVAVSNPSRRALDAIRDRYPHVSVTNDNRQCAAGADIVVLAVKPWIMPGVVAEIKSVLDYNRQTIVSVVGGMNLDDLDTMLARESVTDDDMQPLPAVFHVIPDTAAMVGKSMTFITARRAPQHTVDSVAEYFSALGEVAVVEERLMGAGTALCSCGIAYVYKYVQACVQAGVQLGFYPADALRYVNATIDGAIAMLRANGTLPQQEIDRVTTPGGMTIKGINALEHSGFTSAVIDAVLRPLEK